MYRLLVLLAALLSLPAADALPPLPPLSGDDGVAVQLGAPASRIISLAPHFTDILRHLGAGNRIVGVIDDREQRDSRAESLDGYPLVADAAAINYERILALKPDLVLAWGSGTPRPWIERLRRLGIPVLVLEARRLDDIAQQVEQLGELSGQAAQGRQQAQQLRDSLQRLRQDFGSGPRLRYFYEVWQQPLYSLNSNHLLSQALSLCGADTIIPPGPVAAPLVSPEFVLQQNPDLLLFNQGNAAASLAYWQRFPALAAIREKQWLMLDDRRLTRPGPGMLSAIRPVCAQIAIWRKRSALKQR